MTECPLRGGGPALPHVVPRMIRTVQLTKCFGDLTAVDHLDLEVAPGEFFAFLGPNAAGKTTTIRLLTGLLRPTSGHASIGGFDLQRDPRAAKALVSYVPDFPFLYDKLTPAEFVRFVGAIFDMDNGAVDRASRDLFALLHLDEVRDEQIENLSHGTRQRLVIASALLHDPKAIIIDEPMVGLDPTHARIVKDELKRRSRTGATIFLSTHTLSVAEEMADRIGIIHRGRLIALGTVEELRSRSPDHGGDLERVFLSLVADESAPAEDPPPPR